MLRNVNFELEYIAKKQGFESVTDLKKFVDMVNRKFNSVKVLSKRIEDHEHADFNDRLNEDLPF